MQLPLRDAEPAQQLVVELDDLGVERRVGRADRLDRELVVLAVAPAAGRAVAVHRRDRVRLHRLRLAVQAVLEVRARDRRRALGPKRQRAVAAVVEACTSPCAPRRTLRRRCGRRARCPRSRASGSGPSRRARSPLPSCGRGATRSRRAGRTSCVPRGAWNFALTPARAAQLARGTGSTAARVRASSPGRAPDRRRSRAGSARAASGSTRAASPSRRLRDRPADRAGEEQVAGEELAVVSGTRRAPASDPGRRSPRR